MSQSLKALISKWAAAAAETNHPPPPVYEFEDIIINRFIEDSRQIKPGDCFVARVRTNSDGHLFIQQALDNEAALILAQRPAAELDLDIPEKTVYWCVPDTAYALAWLAAAWNEFPGRRLTVIGITGTDGKTSVSSLLHTIMLRGGRRCGLISTITADMGGGAAESTGLHVTTPEAPAVQHFLRRMVDVGLDEVILESTSIGLAQHRITAIGFDAALLTNITHEHVNDHGTHENYVAAKRRLFEMTTHHRQVGGLGLHILNRDDAYYETISAAADGRVITYGLDLPADVWADQIEYSAEHTAFVLHLPDGQETKIKSVLVGRFNVANMLCAAAAAYGLGIDLDDIKGGLESMSGITGRMERINEGQSFITLVDFAHTPNALEKALEAARPMVAKTKGRILAVFGSAGKRDIEKRRMMAEVSAKRADITILTAEDPRTEALEDILEMMAAGCRMRGGIEGETFWRVPDRGEAIYFALSLARPEDLVIICGKGHEQSMCFGTTEYPWDDREAARQALRAFLAGRPMPNLGLPTYQG